ncbi:MAG: type II secretion system protein GspM [Gemmatimonadota bacterium]
MSPRERRAVLWGAALVAGALLLRGVPWAAREANAAREGLAERTVTLRRTRALVRGVPATRESLATALAGVVALAPALVEGGTQAEAAAALAAAVSLAAGQAALRVVRLDPATDSAPGPIRPVTLRGELQGDIAGLTAFLRAVETGRPLLTVGTFAVTAPDPVPRAGSPEQLRIELEVTGWFLPRGVP